MGSIKLQDGTLKTDQRSNGARLRLDVQDWIKIFVTIGTLAFIIISGWTSLQLTTQQLRLTVDQNVKGIAENRVLARDNKKDIEFLEKSFTRIDAKLDKLIER